MLWRRGAIDLVSALSVVNVIIIGAGAFIAVGLGALRAVSPHFVEATPGFFGYLVASDAETNPISSPHFESLGFALGRGREMPSNNSARPPIGWSVRRAYQWWQVISIIFEVDALRLATIVRNLARHECPANWLGSRRSRA
jgi:hypothetical protein